MPFLDSPPSDHNCHKWIKRKKNIQAKIILLHKLSCVSKSWLTQRPSKVLRLKLDQQEWSIDEIASQHLSPDTIIPRDVLKVMIVKWWLLMLETCQFFSRLLILSLYLLVYFSSFYLYWMFLFGKGRLRGFLLHLWLILKPYFERFLSSISIQTGG